MAEEDNGVLMKSLNVTLQQEEGVIGLVASVFWLANAYYLVWRISHRLPALSDRRNNVRRPPLTRPQWQVLVALILAAVYVSASRLVLGFGRKTNMTMARCQASKWLTIANYGGLKLCAMRKALLRISE